MWRDHKQVLTTILQIKSYDSNQSQKNSTKDWPLYSFTFDHCVHIPGTSSWTLPADAAVCSPPAELLRYHHSASSSRWVPKRDNPLAHHPRDIGEWDFLSTDTQHKQVHSQCGLPTCSPGIGAGSLIFRKLRTKLKVEGIPPSWACCRLAYTLFIV